MEARSERERQREADCRAYLGYDPIPWGKAHIWVSADTDTVRAVVGKANHTTRTRPGSCQEAWVEHRRTGIKAMDDAGYPVTGRSIIIPWKAQEAGISRC